MRPLDFSEENANPVLSVKAAEGKDAQTREAVVLMYVRLAEDEQYVYTMPPELADALAEQLRYMAQRARDLPTESSN